MTEQLELPSLNNRENKPKPTTKLQKPMYGRIPEILMPKNSDGSARYANAPAIEDVMEYWADSNGLEYLETSPIGKASTLTKYGGEGKPQQVWHLFVKDGRHSWPSEKYNRIDTNALILEFLENQ